MISRGRGGFTLVELLVVFAIIAVLIGLLAEAVQKVREAGNRAVCGNNLRQIGIAAHSYHSAHSHFPPGVLTRGDSHPYMAWTARLLPYLDQPNAWEEAVADYARQLNFSLPVPHANLARIMPIFNCPSDGKVKGTTYEGTTAAFTHYLGVSGHRASGTDGMVFYRSRITLRDVADGASQTLFCGERPASADNYFGWWYAGVGQSYEIGALDCHMAVRETNRTFRAPTCRRGPYDFQRGSFSDECSTFHFWSGHPGGAHFGFADGSARFLRYSANDILPVLATRAGGESVELP